MPPTILGPLLLALGSVAFLALVGRAFFAVLKPRHVVDDYARCYEHWHEAEINGCGQGLLYVPQQPINTYTNAAYLAAGVFVAAWLGTPAAWVFALAMGYLCVGSMLFHAVSTHWGQMLDVTGIYAVFSATALYAVAEWVLSWGVGGLAPDGPIGAWLVALLMLVGAGLAVSLLAPRYRKDMEIKIGVLLVVAYAATLLHNLAVWPWVLASIGLFAVAYACWAADKARRFPIVPWGHGVWHLLTAAAAAVAFFAAHRA
ncbi:hypothetical protein [Rubrivirga sp. IMCC43871]|uniref:hypothetical protein n=1 Tax=Rubrivirga sp. IMCC43871 TaxID=3391575 RepID=UPI00398FEBCF